MNSPLPRRQLLQVSTLALIPATGCLDVGIGGEPDYVPLEIENQSNQTQTLSVEFAEADSGEVLLSESKEIQSDATRKLEVGPIDSQIRYTVSYKMGDETGEYPKISGSGLRGVEVLITENRRIEIHHIAS